MLLDIEFPMYEASDSGHSVLEPALLNSNSLETANKLFKVLIQDYKYDVLKQTTMGKKNLSQFGLGNSFY